MLIILHFCRYKEPPNLNEILSNVNVSSPGVKEEDEENDDDDDDDLEDHDMEGKKPSNSSEINPERLKAFNVSVFCLNNHE